MTFPQKHEDQPAAPAWTRGSRQEESNATSLVPDPEDVETAIANLDIGRADLDERHDASSPRYQGATDRGTPAMDNPTPLGRNPSRDATRTNITESVDPETKFLREARPQEPTTRPAIRPVRLDSGTPLPSSPAAPASIASSESGDSHEPSDTLRQLMIDRLFGRWQVWAKKEKILKDRHEKIVREAPLRGRRPTVPTGRALRPSCSRYIRARGAGPPEAIGEAGGRPRNRSSHPAAQ